jgi:serine/threonine protein kinase
VKGCTLAAVVAQEGPMEIARALNLIEEAVGAIGHAHKQGAVHCARKPVNII